MSESQCLTLPTFASLSVIGDKKIRFRAQLPSTINDRHSLNVTITCDGPVYNDIAQDQVFTVTNDGKEWIVIMKVNEAGHTEPEVSESVVDPNRPGYQFMKHTAFQKLSNSEDEILGFHTNLICQ